MYNVSEDDREEYKRDQWETDHPNDYCNECGAIILTEPYLYGDDADGNRGVIRQDEIEHDCPANMDTYTRMMANIKHGRGEWS